MYRIKMRQLNHEHRVRPVCIESEGKMYYVEPTGNETYMVYSPDGIFFYETKDELISKFGGEVVMSKKIHLEMCEKIPKIIGITADFSQSDVLSKALDLLTYDTEKRRFISTLKVSLFINNIELYISKASEVSFEVDGITNTLVFMNKNDVLNFVGNYVSKIVFIDRNVYPDTTNFDPDCNGYTEKVLVKDRVWIE